MIPNFYEWLIIVSYFSDHYQSMMGDITITNIQPDDYTEILEWMKEENWIINENIFEATRLWDPTGWFVAKRDNQPLGKKTKI